MKLSLSFAIALAAATLILPSGQSYAQLLPPPVAPGPPPPPPVEPGPLFVPPPPLPVYRHYYRRQVVYGDICYTSRGDCDLNYSRRVGSLCRCYIPGFGPKRGRVGQ